MAATYPTVFNWKCTDCRGEGEVVITFPCHPRDVVEAVMREHYEVEMRRRCMCPAHPLTMQPKPLEL